MTPLLFGDRCLAREGHCPPLPDGDRRTYSTTTSPGTFAGSASLGEGHHRVHDRDSGNPTVNANLHGWWKRGHFPKSPQTRRADDRGHHQISSRHFKGSCTGASLKPKPSSTKRPFRWSAKQLPRPPENSTTKCTRLEGASRSSQRSGTVSRCKWPGRPL